MSFYISAQKQGQETNKDLEQNCIRLQKQNKKQSCNHQPTLKSTFQQHSQKFRLAFIIAPNCCQLTLLSPSRPSHHAMKHVVFPYNAFSVLPVTESVALVFFYKSTDQITLRPFCVFWVTGQNSRNKCLHYPQIEYLTFQDCTEVDVSQSFPAWPLIKAQCT